MPVLAVSGRELRGPRTSPRPGNGLPAASSQGPAPAVLPLCPWLPVTVPAPTSPLTSHLTGGSEDLAEDRPPTWAPGPPSPCPGSASPVTSASWTFSYGLPASALNSKCPPSLTHPSPVRAPHG